MAVASSFGMAARTSLFVAIHGVLEICSANLIPGAPRLTEGMQGKLSTKCCRGDLLQDKSFLGRDNATKTANKKKMMLLMTKSKRMKWTPFWFFLSRMAEAGGISDFGEILSSEK